MGLDMYLEDGKGHELAYWRKANAVHRWFNNQKEGGLEDCERMEVSKEMLNDLKQVCDGIIEKLKQEVPSLETFFNDNEWIEKNWEAWRPSLELTKHCAEVLPTQSGFFFGSTEYGVGYFLDVKNTSDQISKVLTEHPRCKFKYHAWW